MRSHIEGAIFGHEEEAFRSAGARQIKRISARSCKAMVRWSVPLSIGSGTDCFFSESVGGRYAKRTVGLFLNRVSLGRRYVFCMCSKSGTDEFPRYVNCYVRLLWAKSEMVEVACCVAMLEMRSGIQEYESESLLRCDRDDRRLYRRAAGYGAPVAAKSTRNHSLGSSDGAGEISWHMPTFWQDENVIHFAAFKNHLGIYPRDLSLAPLTERLQHLRHSKGSIRFPYGKLIEYDLIADVIAWRVAMTEGKAKTKGTR